MARLKNGMQITGGVKGLSFYTIQGGDTVYVRTKGGPSAKRMKTGEEFAELRKHQSEWAGCVLFSKNLKAVLGEVAKLADFNLSPVWNGQGKKIMSVDKEHPVGERALRLSQCHEWLAGYNLNKKYPFNAVFRSALECRLHRNEARMTIVIPRFNADNELYNLQKLPSFRLVFTLGVFADLYYTGAQLVRYAPPAGVPDGRTRSVMTEWMPTSGSVEERQYDLALPLSVDEAARPHLTFVAAAGIQFGTVGVDGAVEAVKNACCGKILMVE